ncbi:PucR family transcriptional regulator [Bifidobacterium avesanii]|uniref:PucR family transcriptional regulator n=1 Tax=Bifidobacterium avesanii TaxID=1798157 RepID=A0A7K3TJY8_9BIFI|nr:PucR family transcriptional regulator [Bifidobacterium avesanii]KAB8287260.1 Purine catabolism regulatory protein-like family [Bifidobacterium avesanii]NEG79352.1 hypothetical protein [Bifidobacterium avesanii]
MSLTVSDLLSRKELRLHLVVEGLPGYLDRKVVWVHQSELLKSREFSEPGEILLTTGLNLPHWRQSPTAPAQADPERKDGGAPDPAAYRRMCRDYVQGMFEAGVLACGFGVGVEHDAVPKPLIDAARQEGLPLFEVPLDVPFQSIVRAVSRSLAEDEHRLMRTTYAAQRRLISAAKDEYPLHSVILRTAESIGGWAAFLGPDGYVADISHIAPRAQAEQLGVEMLAQRNSGHEGNAPRTMFLLKDGYDYCASEVRGADQSAHGFVLAGIRAPEETDMAFRSIVIVAAEILSACLPQREAMDKRQRHMRAVMLRALALGHVDILRDMAADLWGALPQGPVCVICVSASQNARDDLYRRLSTQTGYGGSPTAGARQTSPVVFGDYDDRLWIICSRQDLPAYRKLAGAADGDGLPVVGVSRPCLWEHIVGAVDQARIDVRVRTLRRAADVVGSDSAGYIGDLSQVDIVEPEVAETYALGVLAPLIRGRGQSQTRMTLLQTLRALMETSMNVAACAERMRVHRHTIENRMDRIEQILGVDLGDVRDVSRVWFALETLKRGAVRGDASLLSARSVPRMQQGRGVFSVASGGRGADRHA